MLPVLPSLQVVVPAHNVSNSARRSEPMFDTDDNARARGVGPPARAFVCPRPGAPPRVRCRGSGSSAWPAASTSFSGLRTGAQAPHGRADDLVDHHPVGEAQIMAHLGGQGEGTEGGFLPIVPRGLVQYLLPAFEPLGIEGGMGGLGHGRAALKGLQAVVVKAMDGVAHGLWVTAQVPRSLRHLGAAGAGRAESAPPGSGPDGGQRLRTSAGPLPEPGARHP